MTFKTNLTILAGAALASAALAADRYIDAVPEETSMIRVEEGTTTVGGAGLFKHMFVLMAFDPAKEKNFNSVAGGPTLRTASTPDLAFASDAERGNSIYTGGAGAFMMNAGSLDPRIPTDMTKPFTAAFWVKMTAACTQSSARMFFLGPSDRASVTDVKEGESIDCFWGNDKTRTELRFCGGSTSAYKFPDPQVDRWVHLALVCTPTNVDEEAQLNVGLFVNGTRVKGKNIANFTNAADKVSLCLARAAAGSNANNTYFSQFMLFDAALSVDEVAYVRNHTEPLDFPAGWNIDAGGTLVLGGTSPLTALTGAGVCRSENPLALAPSESAAFTGRVDAPSLAFAGTGPDVTQTLAEASAVTASLNVASGTLAFSVPPDVGLRSAFGESLVAYYSFDDPAAPGKDLSGRGNDLKPNPNNLPVYAVTDAADQLPFAAAGRAITFDKPETATTHLGFVSERRRLDGFADTDNAFAVSAWVRFDAVHKNEGPWVFGGVTMLRLHNSSITANYFGDNGSLNNKSFPGRQQGDWHHYAVFYDPTGAGGVYFYEFIDGVLFATGANRSATNKHATDYFRVGTSNKDTDTSWFTGAIDEVIVLNRCNTNDIGRLYGFRRSPVSAPTGALGASVRAQVGHGATLSLFSANETIAQLIGDGNLYLDACSELRVTDRFRFTGTVLGGGRLIVDPDAGPKGLTVLLR